MSVKGFAFTRPDARRIGKSWTSATASYGIHRRTGLGARVEVLIAVERFQGGWPSGAEEGLQMPVRAFARPGQVLRTFRRGMTHVRAAHPHRPNKSSLPNAFCCRCAHGVNVGFTAAGWNQRAGEAAQLGENSRAQ